MGYQIFCPVCGKEITISHGGEKVKCQNPKCDAFLWLYEQFHAGGYQVLVRFGK